MDDDYVWIHDYHLLVLPSLLRKRFHRMRCGLFLHSPFPSSEIFRTFPKREELLRSLLNADLIGQQPLCVQGWWAAGSAAAYHIGSAHCPFSCGKVWQGACHAGTHPSRTKRGSLRPPTCLLPPGPDLPTNTLPSSALQASTPSTMRATSCPAARACWALSM